MYRREKHMLLRHYLEQGMTKAAISRELGVKRRTIYRWIEAGELTVTIGAAFPLRDAAESHRQLASRATIGKLMLLPGEVSPGSLPETSLSAILSH